MKKSKSVFRGLGFIGIALCAACCALPIIGVMLGVGSLSLLAKYFEWAGIAALVLALSFFALYYFKKRQGTSCDIDCECKPVEKLVNERPS